MVPVTGYPCEKTHWYWLAWCFAVHIEMGHPLKNLRFPQNTDQIAGFVKVWCGEPTVELRHQFRSGEERPRASMRSPPLISLSWPIGTTPEARKSPRYRFNRPWRQTCSGIVPLVPVVRRVHRYRFGPSR